MDNFEQTNKKGYFQTKSNSITENRAFDLRN